MTGDRIAELAMGDVRDAKHHLGLLEAFLHRRVMAWYIRAKDGDEGAAEAHAFWLDFEREVAAMQARRVVDARRIAEHFIGDAADREVEPDSASCVQVTPPEVAA